MNISLLFARETKPILNLFWTIPNSADFQGREHSVENVARIRDNNNPGEINKITDANATQLAINYS